MKVLITGEHSYVGNHIGQWLIKKNYCVDYLCVRGNHWKEVSFLEYDAIIHTAAIVHRKGKENWEEYRSVNVDLTEELAKKAKSEGVKSFVYLSSMAVYGKGRTLPRSTVINKTTTLSPSTYYGRSKYFAEEALQTIKDESFSVIIFRPPNIYGKDCPGGYISGYKKLITLLPIFPNVFDEARQSIIYIDNLCEAVYLALVKNQSTVYCVQDTIAPTTVELCKAIGDAIGKKPFFSYPLGKLVKLFKHASIVCKVYGGIEYSPELTECLDGRYRIVSFYDGIRRTIS